MAERIRNTGEKCRLTESERKQLEGKLLCIANRPFTNSLTGCALIIILLGVAPPTLLLIFGFKIAAIIVSVLAAALIAFALICDRQIKKLCNNQLIVLKNNSYDAYKFNAPEKLWSTIHISTGAEEQDHAAIDDDGNLYDFFMDCGGNIFPLNENEFNALKDMVIIVLFTRGNSTSLEYIIPGFIFFEKALTFTSTHVE